MATFAPFRARIAAFFAFLAFVRAVFFALSEYGFFRFGKFLSLSSDNSFNEAAIYVATAAAKNFGPCQKGSQRYRRS